MRLTWRRGKEPGIKIFDQNVAVNVFADTELIGEKAVEMLLNNGKKKLEFEMNVELNGGSKVQQKYPAGA